MYESDALHDPRLFQKEFENESPLRIIITHSRTSVGCLGKVHEFTRLNSPHFPIQIRVNYSEAEAEEGGKFPFFISRQNVCTHTQGMKRGSPRSQRRNIRST